MNEAIRFSKRWPDRKGFHKEDIYQFEDETGEYLLKVSDILALETELKSLRQALASQTIISEERREEIKELHTANLKLLERI
tara:strand:- start:9439 stop:9684 length:246 start_codon:yes stop_codon:yes gene_type:complete